MLNDPDEIVDLWIAAMKDAACGNLTQVQMTLSHPNTGKPTTVRVIVVPEQMGVTFGKKTTGDQDN